MNVDVHSVIMGFLKEMQLPIHFYMQALHNCLSWVNNELYVINAINRKTIKAVVDEFGEVPIPADMVSLSRVGVDAGSGYMNYLIEENNIINDQESATSNNEVVSGYIYSGCLYNYYNEHGEYVGGIYGAVRVRGREYKVIWDRAVIKFKGIPEGESVYIEYTYFDETSSAASIVPFEAVRAVTAYMKWQFYLQSRFNNRFYFQYARSDYYIELRKYRSRINPISTTWFKRELDHRMTLTPKV